VQIGDTGPVESARRSNSRVLGSSFSGLAGQDQLLSFPYVFIGLEPYLSYSICDKPAKNANF
jgi:hypothetical protein